MPSIEQLALRVARLEQELASLRQEDKRSNGNWVQDISGQMNEIPYEEFRKFVSLGKEFRDEQTDRTG